MVSLRRTEKGIMLRKAYKIEDEILTRKTQILYMFVA